METSGFEPRRREGCFAAGPIGHWPARVTAGGVGLGRDVGPLLVVVGLVVVAVGLLAWTGGLSWFGRLPGDIRIERENTRVYIPVVSMLVVSVVVSVVLSLFRR